MFFKYVLLTLLPQILLSFDLCNKVQYLFPLLKYLPLPPLSFLLLRQELYQYRMLLSAFLPGTFIFPQRPHKHMPIHLPFLWHPTSGRRGLLPIARSIPVLGACRRPAVLGLLFCFFSLISPLLLFFIIIVVLFLHGSQCSLSENKHFWPILQVQSSDET